MCAPIMTIKRTLTFQNTHHLINQVAVIL